MLIVALVLAVIGLAALVTAVVTSNALIAWVCIAASVIGVLLLIVDALRERSKGDETADSNGDHDGDHDDETTVLEQAEPAEDYPEEPVADSETESFANHEQTVDPADDDVPPTAKSERI
jgi:hypothetical protein